MPCPRLLGHYNCLVLTNPHHTKRPCLLTLVGLALLTACVDTSPPPSGSSGGFPNTGGLANLAGIGGSISSAAGGAGAGAGTNRNSLGTGGLSDDAGLCPNCAKYCQCELAIEAQAGNFEIQLFRN